MSKWIGKGVLTVDGEDISYGENIPKTIGNEKLKDLISKSLVGDIPEMIDPETLQTVEIKSLEKKIAGFDKAIKALNGEVTKYKTALKSLEKENIDLKKKAG